MRFDKLYMSSVREKILFNMSSRAYRLMLRLQLISRDPIFIVRERKPKYPKFG